MIQTEFHFDILLLLNFIGTMGFKWKCNESSITNFLIEFIFSLPKHHEQSTKKNFMFINQIHNFTAKSFVSMWMYVEVIVYEHHHWVILEGRYKAPSDWKHLWPIIQIALLKLTVVYIKLNKLS